MDDLSTDKASGTQQTVQSPQQSGDSANISASNSNVQPGTTLNTLETTGAENSIPLEAQPVPTVQVGTVSQATALPTGPGTSGVGLGVLSLLLFVTAIVLFISTFRSSKNTTN